ncbi:hypothetical protein DO021_22125 [Desulfobacter hydrogenophilus]|nr:ElyC/SanA/YdcF family protein [Desulfobacter hydrogenophilus]RAL99873.1 hypothetical protein DO021_22125 [Desulfobacter hydrogenophilus]
MRWWGHSVLSIRMWLQVRLWWGCLQSRLAGDVIIFSKILPFFSMPLAMTTALVLAEIFLRRRFLCLAGILVLRVTDYVVNTAAEAVAVVRMLPASARVLLVTSAYYMTRAKMLFVQAGL